MRYGCTCNCNVMMHDGNVFDVTGHIGHVMCLYWDGASCTGGASSRSWHVVIASMRMLYYLPGCCMYDDVPKQYFSADILFCNMI